MDETRIIAATDRTIAYIRVVGRGNFGCSTSLRNYGEQMLHEPLDRLIIDLAECQCMDSTFMGLLAKFGLEYRAKRVPVQIVNASEENKGLLYELGAAILFEFKEVEIPALDWHEIYRAGTKTTETMFENGKTMLEAHVTLMDLDEANAEKFKDVVEGLDKDLKNLES